LQKPLFCRRHLPPYEVFSDECGQKNNFAFMCDDCGGRKKHGVYLSFINQKHQSIQKGKKGRNTNLFTSRLFLGGNLPHLLQYTSFDVCDWGLRNCKQAHLGCENFFVSGPNTPIFGKLSFILFWVFGGKLSFILSLGIWW
jgi:hypothetical protein